MTDATPTTVPAEGFLVYDPFDCMHLDRHRWASNPRECDSPFLTVEEAREEINLRDYRDRLTVVDLTGKQVWPEVAEATDSTEVEALRKQVAELTAEVARLKDQRRERIATAALQGLLAVPTDAPSKTFAIGALTVADALIAKLDGKED